MNPSRQYTQISFLLALALFAGSLAWTAQARYDEYESDYGGYYYYEEPSYEQGYYEGGYEPSYSESYYEGQYDNYYQGNYEPESYGYYQDYYQGYYQSYYEGGYAPPAQTTETVADYQCNRRGHNDDKYCPGETLYVENPSSISFELSGQRFGGSKVWGEICLTPAAGGEAECQGFYGSGSSLGQERGRPGNPYTYLENTVNTSGSGGYFVSYWVYVQDANAKMTVNVTRQNAPENRPVHFVCSNRSCAVAEGPGSDECSSDSQCAGVDAPQASHFGCVGCWACGRVVGAGPDSCGSGVDCACGGPSEAGYGNGQGSYQGGYNGQGSYQGGYQATYSHAECSSQGACVIVNGRGANQCGRDTDCAQPAPSCTISATPDRIVIPPPKSTILQWQCSPARIPTDCSISSVGSVGVSGTMSVSPSETTTYTVTCSNTAGTGSASVQVRVFSAAGGNLKEVVPF